MSFEHVTVIAGGGMEANTGAVYDQWETVVIDNDVNAAYINVLLTTTEITPIGANTQSAFDKWNFPPGTPIEIYANGDLVVNAIVWQYAPSFDAAQHSITVYARTQSYNFVASSIDPGDTGGAYEDRTTYQLVQEWAQANKVDTINLGETKQQDYWQLRQGATGYAEALRLLKPHGQMLFGLMDGGIAVSDGKAMGVQGPIVQGENILRAQARLTDDDFEDNIVNGQMNLGTSLSEALQPTARGKSALQNRRLKLITEPARIDKDRAMQRVMWEQRRALGATTEAMITVPGWHAPAGTSYVPRNVPQGGQTSGMGPLWMLMGDTYIYSPWLKIDCVMRCSRVTFKQSLAEGSTTELTFTDPSAFDEESGTCKSGSMWLPKFDLGSILHGGIGHQ